MQAFPVFLAFLCMGFGDVVGPLVGLARDHFHLSNFMATMIPFVGLLMFLILSIPMGIYQDKKGKKHVLALGLTIAMIGLVIPVFGGLESYGLFLFTILLLGGGMAILQVAGNPVMRDVSPEGKYSRNLSLGQFVKAIGSLSGSLIPVVAARWFHAGWDVLFPIYSVSLLITLIILLSVPIREKKTPDSHPATFRSSFSLLKNGFVALMVLGIFLYVGAELSMSSGIPLYLEDKYGIDIQKLGVAGTGLFFLALMTGRFFGAVILNWMKARKFLLLTTILSIAGVLFLISGIRSLAVISIILIGLSFANVFPLIFSITIDRMPERTNELSGLMITAIVGGAILPVIMGKISDIFNLTAGLLVPLVAILYILYLAFYIPTSSPKPTL
ncbi:MAG: sugar MFS transporter [Chlorobi bacterium]|nr:sugar MFS transporter [Chlorobiota bacterium]